MQIRQSTLKLIGILTCCLSLTGCLGRKNQKKTGQKTALESTQSSTRKNIEATQIPLEHVFYYFALNSDLLNDQARYSLNQVLHYLKQSPEAELILHGHADAQGPEAFNELIAEKRAESAKAYLVRQGFSDQKIVTQGHSNRRLAATGNTAAAHAKNRRVELKIAS
jgi:outer membrane protein OmpA-like peptidoglycan-associated protein